jgi:FtsP/CotA-like multicopper oxidase with cupredoxin domain
VALSPTPFVDQLRLPPTIDVDPGYGQSAELHINLRSVHIRLHSELPETTLWGYEGRVPGPTINLRRNTAVEVHWHNHIPGKLPFAAIRAPTSSNPEAFPSNNPGLDGVAPDPLFAAIPAWTVAHLHGGRTPPDSDGFPTNAVLEGQQIVARYSDYQRATMLWYHDHAMHVTRFNVYAGLAGLWIIRDDQDDAVMAALRAAHGHHHHQTPIEIPLLIQDRNLGVGIDGKLDGSLVHKVEDGTAPAGLDPGPMEFFGPYTLVNGGIWPFVEVRPQPYRLRLVNGSNARTYQLVLLDADGKQIDTPPIQQIGTDGGLIAAPVPVTKDGLLLAPAERADLIIDFSGLPDGTALTWVNIAVAPYDGTTKKGAAADADLGARVPFPNVMQFRVHGSEEATNYQLPQPLSDFKRLKHDQFGEHQHRFIALREEVGGPYDGLLTLWELEKAADPAAVSATERLTVDFDIMPPPGGDPHATTVYRVLSRLFDDRVNFSVRLGEFEVWHIINLTTDTHPFHVHLVQFQVMAKEQYDTLQASGEPRDPQTTDFMFQGPVDIPANELAWKDIVRINPTEKTTIAAKFDGFAGRYVYHCHVLEHEDHDMMRPFDVVPPIINDIMMRDMPMTTGGGMTMASDAPSPVVTLPTTASTRTT